MKILGINEEPKYEFYEVKFCKNFVIIFFCLNIQNSLRYFVFEYYEWKRP